MRDFRDAKAMAQTLRSTLAPKGLNLSHTESLEVMAKILGAKDWNVLSALIESGQLKTGADAGIQPTQRWSGPLILSRDFVLFPKMSAPVFIGRDVSRQAVFEAERGALEIFLVAQRSPGEEVPTREAIFDVGVIADVLDIIEVPPDPSRGGGKPTYKLMLRARQRGRLLDMKEEAGRLTAEVEMIREVDPVSEGEEVRIAFASFRTIVSSKFGESSMTTSIPGDVARLDPAAAARIIARVEKITRPGALADFIAQSLPMPIPAKQGLLETLDPAARLAKAVTLLSAQAA